MKKNKLFAPFLTLLAVAIAMGMMLYWGYKLIDMLWILLVVLVIFYTLGALIQKRVNKFCEANEELERQREELEGAVIEKEASGEEATGQESVNDEEEHSIPPLTGEMPERERPEL